MQTRIHLGYQHVLSECGCYCANDLASRRCSGHAFFSPANVIKLLENVRGANTSPQVCTTVMALGKQLGKNPVLVGVCDGFVGNRMLSKRTRESYFMLEEGAKLLEEGIVSRALVNIDVVWLNGYGFPAYRGGPMFYADQIGLQTVYEGVLKYEKELDAEYWTPSPLLAQLAREGRGFYAA